MCLARLTETNIFQALGGEGGGGEKEWGEGSSAKKISQRAV